MGFIYFILLVGILVFVHEFGHFIWAKIFGVKVLCFSLGFGAKLVGIQRGDTEYRIAALPIGGYVRMLGEDPKDVIQPADEGRAFHQQALWKRLIIVIAGPLMNLAFPVALYFVAFLGESDLAPSTVGAVLPGRASENKLMPGDRIVRVNDTDIETKWELDEIVRTSAGEPLEIVALRGETRIKVRITPTLATRSGLLDIEESYGHLGILSHHPMPIVGVMDPASPAAQADMRTFDVIAALNGRPTQKFSDVAHALDANRGSMVPVSILRPVRVERALGGLVEMDIFEPHIAMLTPETGSASGLTRAGLEPADLYVNQVVVGSPEHRLGLAPGDRLLDLDGAPLRSWQDLLESLRLGGGKEHHLRWRHGATIREGTFRLTHEQGVSEHGQVFDRFVVTMANWVPTVPEPRIANPHPVRYAWREALRATHEAVELTVVMALRLVQGKVTVRSIGGPLTIFEVAGTAARAGAINYLMLMAFISINLGLMNLLPIPMLDGGHLLFFGYEAIMRKPASIRVREYASLGGLILLVFFMGLALRNDLERQWPAIRDAIESTQ